MPGCLAAGAGSGLEVALSFQIWIASLYWAALPRRARNGKVG
jgi:hypothetical protein